MPTLTDIATAVQDASTAEQDRIAKVAANVARKSEYDASHEAAVTATKNAADTFAKVAELVAAYKPSTDDVL